MRFGEVPVTEAAGAILAHSVALPGGRLRKGQVLGPDEVASLRAADIARVTVAVLERDDVAEDAAALRLARALVPDETAAGLILKPVGTGRVNILAAGPGIVRVGRARVDRMNAADPMMTLATVAPWQRMEAGGMVGTVKIISYAVPEAALAQACDLGAAALALCPPVRRRVALIQTRVGEEDGAKGHRVTAARVERLGGTLVAACMVAHETEALADALRGVGGADLILVLTGSATSDRRDTGPEAVRRAGGVVEHFGMPVDPGNLLFLGLIGPVPLIGLPGCARSPALNGADRVLERIMCGQRMTGRMISGMGVGGLLKEIPSRPRPREGS